MAASSPSLSISDIMHPLSPPPASAAPNKSPTPPPRAKSATPEPLEPAEIDEMRRKVISMGWGDSSKGKEKANSREEELANMLLRITHPAALPQPSQLHAQAETIANLIQQRDFLVHRSMEEHERWESDRESWARAAQALILQGRREAAHWEGLDHAAMQYGHGGIDAPAHRMQEYERINAAVQSEKKLLQQKLNETQHRLTTLESELAQLRPLLLMQPFALMHSHPTGTSRGWTAAVPSLGTPGRGAKDRRDAEDDHEAESDEDHPALQLQPRPQFRNPILRPVGQEQPSSPQKKGDYYRRRDTPISGYPPSVSKGKGVRKGAVTASTSSKAPLLSDARSEHLLLAARKIGMQRATMLTGAFSHLHQPPLPEPPASPQKRRAPASPTKTPKTPRRSQVANTPLLTRTPLNLTPSHQRTPLQSLLSAAQSVLSAPAGPPESPLAKKRKLDHSVTVLQGAETPSVARKDKGKEPEKEKEKDDTTPVPVSRVKSALDFLADQAAAYSSQAPSQASMDDGDNQQGGNGDEEETQTQTQTQSQSQSQDVEMTDVTQDNDEGITTRRSSRIKEKGKQKATPKDVEPLPVETPPGESSQCVDQIERLTTPNHTTRSGSTETMMLAPPISLEPRSSRSPAPPNPSRNSNRSRSQSAERHSSMDSMSGSSFNMFSLQRPQPLAATGPSVLNAQGGEYVEEQGPSMLLTSRIDGVKFITEDPPHRTRSPYVKWTKEEDELLAKAVAKYGQKWDLVQKELPSRGYHQVRQRWLRKLGVLEGSKLDLANVETNAAADFINMSTALPTDNDSPEPQAAANMKLGLAPLSSEKALMSTSTSVSTTSGGESGNAGPSNTSSNL
ncbi:hypothetical protein M422DRAFT_40768 [Sphaerobolus stellatus SS14]|nr:hypothetical protein M422DRAFT_40768 [Sphaerobolus stellatus SS14]